MPKTPGIEVTLLGRAFRVACPPEEREQLLAAVAYLDAKMREIRDSSKVVGMERVAVMAALNIAHELLNARVGSFDVGDYKRRIHALERAVDAALANQSDLFQEPSGE